MDLSLILNPVKDESPQRHIKVETSSLQPANMSSSPKPPASMTPFAPITITTMDMDADSSGDETVGSSLLSASTDGFSTDTDAGLSSGDDEVISTPLFIDDSRRDTVGAKVEDDSDVDNEAFSSTDDECMEEAPKVDTEEENSRCQYMRQCNTGSLDYRKVVSHIFGRNKKCTTQIPEDCWIEYCRKHYQRTRYRTTKAQSKQYFNVQFDILLRQLTRLQRWDGVRSWEIAIRKKERDTLKKEDDQMVRHQSSGRGVNQAVWNRVHQCKERMLMPYLGKRKTYEEVWQFLDFVQQEVERGTFDDMPGFELLPDIDPHVYPPRGEARAPKESEDDDELFQPPSPSATARKLRLLKRSSSTPNRISKPTSKKETAKKTRRLVQASQRNAKFEEESKGDPVVAGLRTTTESPVSPTVHLGRGLTYTDSPLPKSSPSTPSIASPSQSGALNTLPSFRKEGVAHRRLPIPIPRTPSPIIKSKEDISALASSTTLRSGFRPINTSPNGVAYGPATPKTPPGAVSPSPQVRNPHGLASVDTNRRVVFTPSTPYRIPKRVHPREGANDA